MAETRTGASSIVTHPDGVTVWLLDTGPGYDPTRGFFVPGQTLDPLLDVLTGSGLTLHDAVELDVPVAGFGIRGDLSGPLEIAVDVGAVDGAVVLLEHDGAYRWVLPEAAGSGSLVRQPGLLRFWIEPPAREADAPEPVQRGPIADAVIGWVGGKIRTYVLRYVAGVAAEVLAARIDGEMAEQLVSVAGPLADFWSPPTAPVQVAAGRRILLLLHGTFSSTSGSFAALTATAPGRALLSALSMRYDAVLGFDHRTLTRDPDENARALQAALQALNLPAGTQFDAVAYSRGGLVLRVLVEELLPQAGWPLQPGRLVFVGCTNGGTALADPVHWKRLIDIYTNIVVAGTWALGLVPGLGTGAATVRQVMESIGRFVQYMAEAAIDERRIPGLAAMMPESDIIRRLNGGQPAAGSEIAYFSAGATFAPHEDSPGFKAGMYRAALDWVADEFFTADNDLVVNSLAMAAFGQHAARLRARQDFAADDGIYHTIYFGSAKLIDRLGDWLLDQPGLTGRLIGDVTVVDAELSAGSALGRIDFLPADAPVVISRTLGTELFCYLRTAGELAAVLRPIVAAASPPKPPPQQRQEREQQQQQQIVQQQQPEPDQTWRLGPTLTDALQLHEGDAADIFAVAPLLQRGGQDLSLRSFRPGLPKLSDAPGSSGVVVGADGHMAVLLDSAWAARMAPAPILGIAGAAAGVSVRGVEQRPASRTQASSCRLARRRLAACSARTRASAEDPISLAAHAMSHPETCFQPAAPPPTPAAAVEEAQIECYFEAEMAPHPPLAQSVTITVTLSAEAPATAAEATHKTASAPASPALPIAVTATARRNCSIEGPATATVMPPAAGQPMTVRFEVRGKAQGEAEIWIEAFQADRRMVVLALTPLFLDTAGRLCVGSTGATAQAEGALIDLRIRDLNRNDGDTVRLEYSIQSEELQILREEESVDHPENTRLAFIRSIYDDVAGLWRTASQAPAESRGSFLQSFGDDLRVAGGALCDTLVPERIRGILFDAWQQNRVGAIRVLTREPSIPWEMLFLHKPGGRKNEGCFLAELGLVRWNAALGYPPTRLRVRPGHSFYLIPDYPPRYRLAGAADDRALIERLFSATAVEATTGGVRRFFDTAEFDLLHVACHGEAVRDRPWESGLLLGDLDPAGRPMVLKAARVEQSETQPSRPVVFLNACQVGLSEQGLVGAGGMAQAFLFGVQAGVVAAPMWSVLDATASSFAQEFFEQLCNGAALAQAARRARSVAKLAGDPSWLAYSVWGHPYARLEIDRTGA